MQGPSLRLAIRQPYPRALQITDNKFGAAGPQKTSNGPSIVAG